MEKIELKWNYAEYFNEMMKDVEKSIVVGRVMPQTADIMRSVARHYARRAFLCIQEGRHVKPEEVPE